MLAFKKLLLLVFPLVFLFACDRECADKDCFNGTCSSGTCDCDEGWYKDANGLCTQKDCGAHGTYDINQNSCACEPFWSKDAAGKCNILDCGPHGTFNPTTLTCDCDAGYMRDADGRCTLTDPCDGINCGANGTCNPNTGSCDCDPGYATVGSGPCEELRNRFIGTWQGTWTDDFGFTSSMHTMTIAAEGTSTLTVRITNFMNQTCVPLSAPWQVIGSMDINLSENWVGNFVTLCSENTLGSYGSFWLVTPTNMSTQVFVERPSWSRNLSGSYVKQ